MAATRDGGGFTAPGRMPPPRPSSAAGDGEAVADVEASPEKAAQQYAEKGALLAPVLHRRPDPRTPRHPEQGRGLAMGRRASRLRLAMAVAARPRPAVAPRRAHSPTAALAPSAWTP